MADRNGWRCISTYDTKNGPDIVLIQYENGHVTVGEYLEHHDGGPDDHQTWDPYTYPRDDNNLLMMHEWPVAWQPFPEPLTREQIAGLSEPEGEA